MLKVENIVKSYGENKVLKGLNLEIFDGEIYGLIGSNGAGKTTLFNIIAQILSHEEGKVFLNGKEIKTINDLALKVGYIIDIPSMFEYLTANEYLEFLYSSSKKNKEEIKARSKVVLDLVGLEDVGNKRINSFSRGMKQRMGIAAGLIFEPDLIVMDEPSSALDPQGRAEVIDIIKDLKKQGKTIILSTHILNDIERLCDRVGLLVNGVIAVEGTVSKVLDSYTTNKIKVYCGNDEIEKIGKILKELEQIQDMDIQHDGAIISFKDNDNKKQILKKIVNGEIVFSAIEVNKMTLEEIFLKVSNEK